MEQNRIQHRKNMKIRKNIRLKNFDYKTNGAYFLTMCTDFRRNYIKDKERLVIERELIALQKRFSGIKIVSYTIMPTHIHFIMFLDNAQVSLSKIIQAFKSITTLQLKKLGFEKTVFWQRNFYEHVIRHEQALIEIRKYILNNPRALHIKMNAIYGYSRASSTFKEYVEQARPLQK